MTQSAPTRRSGATALFRAATWKAFGYHWLSVLLAPLALSYAATAVSLGAGLLVTWAGLVIPAAMILGARGWGALIRGLTRHLLGSDLSAPLPFAPRRGFVGFLRSALTDAAGWRALAHMFLSFLTSMTLALLSICWLVTALGGLTHWFWYRYMPLQWDSDGTLQHRGTQVFPDVWADSPEWQWIFAGVGMLLLLLWPSINNGTARAQAVLAGALLTPTASSRRVRELEVSRSASVEDADARLRRIERDLHDGTQAQLVAIAMKVGDARDRLSEDAGPEVLALLDSANGTAKEALVDLRGLARGIRPAALEGGLDTALATLVAGAALPVTLEYSLVRRPAPSIEAIAYFCASELVTNAVKHSGGTRIDLVVTGDNDDGLRLAVSDNGHGGAAIGRRTAAGTRTGLAGLQERIGSVDGWLEIDSPAGGPTRISVELPLSSKA